MPQSDQYGQRAAAPPARRLLDQRGEPPAGNGGYDEWDQDQGDKLVSCRASVRDRRAATGPLRLRTIAAGGGRPGGPWPRQRIG